MFCYCTFNTCTRRVRLHLINTNVYKYYENDSEEKDKVRLWKMNLLLGEDNQAHQLFGAGIRKALVSTLLLQIGHEVKNGLTAQDFVAHIGTQHDTGLVLHYVGHKARPDGEPEQGGTKG